MQPSREAVTTDLGVDISQTEVSGSSCGLKMILLEIVDVLGEGNSCRVEL
jgi:PDZ domain-containing secreted protein